MIKHCVALVALILSINCEAATVIPIEIDKSNALALGRINGHSVKLVVDSGGGVVALKPSILDRIGASSNGAQRTTTDVYGKSSNQPTFTLRALELGGTTFPNVQGGATGTYTSRAPGDGILGRYFLNQFIVSYDYKAKKITLFAQNERDKANAECGEIAVPLQTAADELIVSKMKTDHEELILLWDSGATHSFLKQSFVDQHELPFAAPFYTTDKLIVGDRNLGAVKFVVLDMKEPASVDGYLGFNFFMLYEVCTDPEGREVRLRKY